MAFLAPVAAQVGGMTIKKILPWAIVAVAVIGLGGFAWIQSARLHAAQETIGTLRDRADTLAVDVLRWQKSAADMQGVIDDQAAQLTRQTADLAKAQSIADETAQQQAAEISDLNNQLDALKARANAHPDQVRPLGPIVLDVLGGMRGEGRPAAPAAPAVGH